MREIAVCQQNNNNDTRRLSASFFLNGKGKWNQ